MTFLPIVSRELRVASRRGKTYWSRVGAGGAAMVAFLLVMLLMQLDRQATAQTIGAMLFRTLLGLDFLICLAMGIQLTSDCISQEKREGTLGFLFLTDLKGYDVILGKLSATSLAAGYAALATLPVLGVTMLLGGVSLTELGQAALVLANTILFSLSAGIFVSTWCRDARTSAAMTFVVILLSCIVPPIIGFFAMLRYTGGYVEPTDTLYFCLALNPVCACFTFTGPFAKPWMFWMSSSYSLALSCLFLMLSARIVRATWQDRPASARWARWRALWQTWLQGNRDLRRRYRRRLLDVNAVLWLTSRNRLKVFYMWTYFAMAVVFWLWGYFQVQRDWLDFNMTISICFVNHLVLKMAVVTEAGERYGLDLQSGALELLLATRMRVEDFLGGQLLALRRHFFKPAIAILLMDLVLLGLSWERGGELSDKKSELAFAMMAGMVVLVADLLALSWVGMWTGLTAKDLKKASSGALVLVLGPPGILVPLAELSWQWLNPYVEFSLYWRVTIWLVASLVTDYVLGRWAWRRLHGEFRLLAMRRYDPAVKFSLKKRIGAWGATLRRFMFPPDAA